MKVFYDKYSQRIPIKMWLPLDKIEYDCLEQAKNLSNLPFAYKHIALMPDAHLGMGMPIGGIIATEDVVIPNAVGVDQGCGMIFARTNLMANGLRIRQSKGGGSLLHEIVGTISRNIPTGFKSHKSKQLCRVAEELTLRYGYYKTIFEEDIENMMYQVGTLGGGNHFIELQEDAEGYLCIMIHSGSRNFGYKVANYYNKKAEELNEKWYSSVPKEFQLPFLPVDSEIGGAFLDWTNVSLRFAEENRARMMEVVKRAIEKTVEDLIDDPVDYLMEVNAHHNYVSLEHHFGKDVWVHRKGAIRVREGDLGIVPGAMGSFSYIVQGKGNPESFYSCSYGAGRIMSRKQATETFTLQQMMEDLKDKDVILSTDNKENVVDESRFAYKDITEVMANQKDLVHIVKELETVAVIKGSDSSRRKKKKKKSENE